MSEQHLEEKAALRAQLKALREAPERHHPEMHDEAVVYEANKITAYFDAEWDSCAPADAVYAKVWTAVEGRVQVEIIKLHQRHEAPGLAP